MSQELKRRFALINTWPHFKAAEHEAMARIRNAAGDLGLECVFVDRYLNKIEDDVPVALKPDEVDFVINLHFESGKVYDAFSVAALWNPLRFFYDWGYQIYSKHVDSHDDFLTCGSQWADDHLVRRIRGDRTRLPPAFALYHSLANPVLEPQLDGDKSLFYCGINWEKLGKPVGRYHELLTLLDKTGDLRIYGPREFHGVAPWEGYASYVAPIPFDGVSVVGEIAKCGIALVLSSDAHKESGLMSARMYESLAAGAIIIADENPFLRQELGDDALYIDGSRPGQEVFERVCSHIEWIRRHPQQAHEMAVRAQAKFKAKYAMDVCLRDIYAGLEERKRVLREASLARGSTRKVHLVFPMYRFSEATIVAAREALADQSYDNIEGHLVVDATTYERHKRRIDDLSGTGIHVVAANGFSLESKGGDVTRKQRMGTILVDDILPAAGDSDLVMVIDPAETLFRDHVSRLVRLFEDRPGLVCAASDLLIRHYDDKRAEYREIRSGLVDVMRPLRGGETLGWARFLMLASRLRQLAPVVRYLDETLICPVLLEAVLVGGLAYGRHATLIHDVQKPSPRAEGAVAAEKEIILDAFRYDLPRLAPYAISGSDLMPDVQQPAPPISPPPTVEVSPATVKAAIESMSPKARQKVFGLLFESVPQPAFVRGFVRRFYRSEGAAQGQLPQ